MQETKTGATRESDSSGSHSRALPETPGKVSESNLAPSVPGVKLDLAQAATQTETIWLGRTGIVYLAANVPGSKLSTDWMQWFFEWPQQSSELLDKAAELAPTKEVYIGVLPHDAKDGKRESCQPSYWLWADIDDRCDQAKLSELEAMVIESGRPGNLHIYLRLASALDVEATELWNRRLAKHLGADPSGVDAGQVLRLAGTTNHKPEGGPVRFIRQASRYWTLEELDAVLPAVQRAEKGSDDPLPQELPEQSAEEIIAKYEHHVSVVDGYAVIPELFEDEPGNDWSRRLWRLARELQDAGAPPEERLVALEEAACNKIERDGRPREALWENYVTKLEVKEQPALVDIEVELKRPPGYPRLDAVAYRGLAGEVVRTILPYTEADPAALLLVFLTEFGNAVGASPHFWVGGRPHPPRLYSLLVGETDKGKKGTAQGEVDYLFSLAVWNGRTLMGLSTGEGLAEYLTKAKGKNDAVLVVEEEFAKFLTVMARPDNTLSMVVRVLFDKGDVDVPTRKEPIHVRGANLSMVCHVTPQELRERLSSIDAANGFGNRFLIGTVQRSKLLPKPKRVPTDQLFPLADRLQIAINQASGVGELSFTEAFDSLWEPQYREWAEADTGGLAGTMKARAGTIAKRLALAYALLDGSSVIDADHLEAALAVWRYAEASIDYLFGDSTGNDKADRILEHLTDKHPEAIAKSQLYALFGRNITKAELDIALKLLTERELIEIGTPKTGTKGRPKEYIRATEAAVQR